MDEIESASLIVSLPPVVYSILSHTSLRDLNSFSRVCRLWRDLADLVKKERIKPFCFHYHYCCRENCTTPCFPPCKSGGFRCIHAFKTDVEDLPCDPMHTFMFSAMFMHPSLKQFFESLRPQKKKNRRSDNSQLGKDSFPYLLYNSEVSFCTTIGIAGSGKWRSENMVLSPSLSTLYIPRVPGVETYQFPIAKFQRDAPASEFTGIPDDVDVKCMLIFLNAKCRKYLDCFIYDTIIPEYLRRQKWKMALGGIFVESMFFPKHKLKQDNQCYGIAFAGRNVEAASITIPEDINSEEEIIQELKILKGSDLLKGQCFALMFTCMERTNYDGKTEGDIFRKVFPTIPFIGVFGMQFQIGINYIPNILEERNRKFYSWGKGNSLVFVIISIKC